MSQFDSEKLIAALGAPMDKPDNLAKDLQALLSTGGSLFYVLNQLRALYDERQELFSMQALFTDEGVKKAISNQGELRGINIAIQLIIGLAQEENKE